MTEKVFRLENEMHCIRRDVIFSHFSSEVRISPIWSALMNDYPSLEVCLESTHTRADPFWLAKEAYRWGDEQTRLGFLTPSETSRLCPNADPSPLIDSCVEKIYKPYLHSKTSALQPDDFKWWVWLRISSIESAENGGSLKYDLLIISLFCAIYIHTENEWAAQSFIWVKVRVRSLMRVLRVGHWNDDDRRLLFSFSFDTTHLFNNEQYDHRQSA